LPCFLLMVLLGGVNWAVQERVLPRANQLQDTTRELIRNHGIAASQPGKYWVADDNRIYSFKLPEGASDNEKPETKMAAVGRQTPASDNEKQDVQCPARCVTDLSVYEFGDNGTHLQSVYRAKTATWAGGRIVFTGNVEKSDMRE